MSLLWGHIGSMSSLCPLVGVKMLTSPAVPEENAKPHMYKPCCTTELCLSHIGFSIFFKEQGCVEAGTQGFVYAQSTTELHSTLESH